MDEKYNILLQNTARGPNTKNYNFLNICAPGNPQNTYTPRENGYVVN